MAETLAVVGLGYVGLPLAVQAAGRGYRVIGIDLNPAVVDMANNHESPFVNDERFEVALRGLGSAALRATTEFRAIHGADTVVICVPTPTRNNVPDLSYVTGAAASIGDQLQPGQFVSLESTVNPGVTRGSVLPILEERSGLKVGAHFNLAHCPERIDPGNTTLHVGNINRVVGGITAACTDRALQVYDNIIDAEVVPLGSPEEAEFVKSWENTYRNVMIAMANEAAIICAALGMDVARIQNGLQSKVDQFGLRLAIPGIGPGGHCIPEDIYYVIAAAQRNGLDTRLLLAAAELNDSMPSYAYHRMAEMMTDNGENIRSLNVALLGLAYKPGIADMRRSPSIDVGHHLVRQANSVVIHDPYADIDENTVRGALVVPSIEAALEYADAVFVGTAHDEYVQMLTAEMLAKFDVRYVLDGRNCLNKEAILKNGIRYRGIGR